MYYEGTNQKPKLQRSSKTGREKWDKATLQSRRVCKKKDLISSLERSHLIPISLNLASTTKSVMTFELRLVLFLCFFVLPV